MGDIDKKLFKRIKDYREQFLGMHETNATKHLLNMKNPFDNNVRHILNHLNQGITWACENEGYIYYYELNLRWVIGIAYILHESDSGWDKLSFEYLQRFVDYKSSEAIGKNIEIYEKKRAIYRKKIKKIWKIFGI